MISPSGKNESGEGIVKKFGREADNPTSNANHDALLSTEIVQ